MLRGENSDRWFKMYLGLRLPLFKAGEVTLTPHGLGSPTLSSSGDLFLGTKQQYTESF